MQGAGQVLIYAVTPGYEIDDDYGVEEDVLIYISLLWNIFCNLVFSFIKRNVLADRVNNDWKPLPHTHTIW